MNFSVIGTGNLAFHLIKMLQTHGHVLMQVVGRNENTGRELASMFSASYINHTGELSKMNDVVFVAVKDGAIAEVAASVSHEIPVVHSSGNSSIQLLPQNSTGVVWPLFSFSKTKTIDYASIPFLIETNNPSLFDLLFDVFQPISGKVFNAPESDRRKVHLAAVLANNFTNHLMFLADEVVSEIPLPFDILLPMIHDQINSASHNTLNANQTGPARRADMKTIADHLAIIKHNDGLTEIYKSITNSILATYHGKKL